MAGWHCSSQNTSPSKLSYFFDKPILACWLQEKHIHHSDRLEKCQAPSLRGQCDRLTRCGGWWWFLLVVGQVVSMAADRKASEYLFWVLLWAYVSLGLYAFSGDAKAATDSIRALNFGVKVANALWASGWPDEAVVFALVTLFVTAVTMEERAEGGGL
ncbi:uncharacterized protein Fot_51427 [Forsythia ovata]|uniref:Uncharacterized protein n=1 Tax=Forsythia ovata TaxID=205694 RepID=A0ABD1PWG1_9LAMI